MRVDDPLGAVIAGGHKSMTAVKKRRWSIMSIAQAFVFPDRTVFWAGRLRRMTNAIGKIAPDVIITSSPSLSTHFAGWYFAKRTGAKWVAEFRDPVSWLPKKDTTSSFKRYLLSKIEAWAVRQADVVVTISEAFSEYFRKIYKDEDIRTVPNGAELDEIRISQNMKNVANRKTDGQLTISHAGFLYGGIRNPQPLIAAAKKAQLQTSRPIMLHFIGIDSHIASVAAEKLGVADMVVSHASLGHTETVKLTEQAHGLVALLPDDPLARIGLMSKFFDYVATGNPILVVGEKEAMFSRLVEDDGAGKAYEYHDVDGIAAWIVQLANQPEEMRPKAMDICRKWSADAMANSMENLFVELTDSG